MKKLTEKEFLLRVNEVQTGQLEVLSPYINNTTKVRVRCKKCGLIWLAAPKELMRRKIGKNCNHHIKQNAEMVRERVKIQTNGKFSIIGNYRGAKKKCLFKCDKCGYTWETEPYLIYKGISGCPKEANNIKHNTAWFKEQVKKLTGNEYTVFGEYQGNKKKVLLRHNACGRTFEMAPNSFLSANQRCPFDGYRRAAAKNMIPLKEAKQKLNQFKYGDYKIADESQYKGITKNVPILHKKCGNIWECPVEDILTGNRGCPYCASSKGESVIRKYLSEHHFKYKEQFRIDECRNKRPLPFDFAIFKDGQLTDLIEYQGVQHYRTDCFNMSEDEIASSRKRDHIKQAYCKEHHINLISIPHNSHSSHIKTIEKLVYRFLNKHLQANPEPSLVETQGRRND